MVKYLLAAEADKIQDLLFRSSHLREVAGGSQMLTEFCKTTARNLAQEHSGRWIISEGGGFRVLFDDSALALTFGDALAEAYRRNLGGTLTIATPEPLAEPVEQHFRAASNQAHQSLRQAKQHQARFIASEHIPYVAFCVSCGVGLSIVHTKISQQNVQGQYLCSSCKSKSAVWNEHKLKDFLGPFYAELERQHSYENIPVAEDVGKLDHRNYVAYLAADGNSMGCVFSQCATDSKLRDLSENLPKTIRASLAEPTRTLIELPEVREKMGDRVAVLPLIMGGDDLFALIPAPWALDFAYRFAQAYEENAKLLVKDITGASPPTISIAVVICKAKYPYYLAHQRGEELLKAAKRMVKRWAFENHQPLRSTIAFDVILGSRLAGEEPERGTYRSTLQPYWVRENVSNWGLSTSHLIAQRFELRKLPHKRLAQLRRHFDRLSSLVDQESAREEWAKQLEKLMRRILKVSDKDETIPKTLEALGGKALYRVSRPSDEENWYGHAFPDLISAWDYTYSLCRSRADYDEE